MTDPRLSRVRRVETQIADLAHTRYRTDKQEKLLASLKRERQKLLDAIELDRRQLPLFPEDGGQPCR